MDPLLPLLDLDGVADAAEAARAAVDRLRAHRILRRRGEQVSAESALHAARASAALDGADYPLAQVRSGAVDDPVVQGALRVSTALGPLVATWRRAPLQVLARLHTLAAAGLEPAERLGRPVTSSPRLPALAALVVGESSVPAVVMAAVVHGELLALDAFGAGNGVLARAAARLVMIERGLDPRAFCVPEVGHLEHRAEYRSALAAYSSGGADGVGRWLKHCCTAVESGAAEGLAICTAMQRAG